MPKTIFPTGFESIVEQSSELQTSDRPSYEELWLPTNDVNAHRQRLWLKIGQIVNGLALPVDSNQTALPVYVTGYRKSEYSRLRQWFRSVGHTGEVNTPNHFSILRQFAPNKTWEALHRDYQPDSKGVILYSDVFGRPSEEEISDMYPQSQIIRAKLFDLVCLQEIKPRIWKRSFMQTFGAHKKLKIESHENDEPSVSNTPFTPEQRAIIEKDHTIVYERAPENADRTIICFKHVHGTRQDPVVMNIFNPVAEDLFAKHQSDTLAAALKIMEINDIGKTKLFLESTPQSYNSLPSDYLDSTLDWRTIADHKEGLSTDAIIKKLSFETMIPERLLHLLINSHQHPRTSLVQSYLDNQHEHHLYGDGRHELYETMAEKCEELRNRVMSLSVGRNQAGQASDYAMAKNERDSMIFDEAHKVLAYQISKAIQPGDSGILLYGGGHFSSGSTNEELVTKTLIEGCLSNIPKLQVFVVEHKEYSILIDHYKEMWKRMGAVKEGALFSQSIELIDMCAKAVPYTLQQWLRSSDQQKKLRHWASAKELLRDYQIAYNFIRDGLN